MEEWRTMSKFSVFQNFYANLNGKVWVTDIEVLKHPSNDPEAPAANHTGWQSVTNGFKEVGAGRREGNTLIDPTNIALASPMSSRYLKFSFKNDGRHGGHTDLI